LEGLWGGDSMEALALLPLFFGKNLTWEQNKKKKIAL